MSKYLESFIQSIPAIQGKQIMSILNELRNSGVIRTVEEYQKKLQELTLVLAQGKPVPISKLFLGSKTETIDSESFNFMLNRFSDDIDTLLNEISLIADTANAHRSIVNDKLIKDIELSISSLAVDIKKNEALAKSALGFSVVQYNDFSNQDELRFARSEGKIAADLFYDRRSKTVLSQKYDAAVDIISKSMTLPYEKSETYTITNVDVEYTTSADARYFNVDFPEFSINQIIDNQSQTYWATSIMADEIIPGGASIELVITVDGLREVSYIEIDPILYNDFYVDRIAYANSNDEQIEIIGSANKVLIDQPKKISFSKITTRKIIVGLLQKTHVETTYYASDVSTIYDAKIREADIGIDVLGSELYKQDSTQPVIELLNIPGEAEQSQVSGNAYIIGLDNIRVGNATYTDTGIYVSKPLKADAPILMALETKEEYGYLPGSSLPNGSIEYSVRKQNYDASDILIDTEVFNILPTLISTVNKEHLVINRSSREAFLRFRAKTSSGISVYINENQTPLAGRIEGEDASDGDNYEISIDGTKIIFLDNDIPNNVIFDISAIYTISYEPERDIYINSAATIFMDKDNMIELTIERPAFPVARSEIYLVTVMRRSVLNANETPSIDEYNMFVALKDDTRFTNGA